MIGRSARGPFLALLLVGAVGSAAGQSIPVTAGGDASSLVGVTFDLPLEIDMSARSELLGSFALSMRWDPSVLELVGGQEGDFGSITVNQDSVPFGVLLASGVKPSGAGGRITALIGRFRPLVSDTTTLEIGVTELYAAGTFADMSADAVPMSQPYCPALGRYGDLDGDGAANSRDALIALSASVGLDVSGFNVTMGDVDGNGSTEARDALIILSYAVGLDVSGFQFFTIAPGACASGTPPALTLDPGDVNVAVGQEVEYQAIGVDTATGQPIAVTNVFWSSSDESVAVVGPGGRAVALASGTAVITARQSGGDSASATMTVSSSRHVFWVDALAAGARNQIGDSALPLATIQAAVDVARDGDTVRVRPGRYAESVTVRTGVVIEGDTSMGGLRPLIAASDGAGSNGFVVDGPSRVELRNLRTDTLYTAVSIPTADTVVIDNVEFRLRESGSASIDAGTVGALYVLRSRLFGPATANYYNNGIYVASAGLVAVDSSVIADYGNHGLYLEEVDSLDLQDNQIRNNYGWGVWVCSSCYTSDTTAGVGAVLMRNRIENSQDGQVWIDLIHSGHFEHNVFRGSAYYNAVELSGHRATVVSSLADSFDVQGGPWLDFTTFDSLLVDSVVVSQSGSYGYLYDGRVATLRNASFLELDYYYALDVEGYADTTTLRLQNILFAGPDSSVCNQCGDAVYAGNAHVIADGVTGTNLSEAFNLSQSRLDLSNSTFDRAYYVIDSYCSSVSTDGVSATNGQYGVYHSACSLADTAAVTNSQFQYFYEGLVIYDGAAVVTGSSFRDIDYPLYASCADVELRNDTLSNGYYGLQHYGCSAASDALTADSVWVEQFASYGLYTSYTTASITNSVFVDNATGVYLAYGPAQVTDNTISGFTNDGAYVYPGGYGSTATERNTVTCALAGGATDGIAVYGSAADTMAVRDNVVSDCQTAIYMSGAVGEVRGNTITIPASLRGTSDYGISARGDTSLVVVGNTVTGPAYYGSIYVNNSDWTRADSNTVNGATEAGIYTYYTDSLWVRDNLVMGQDTSSCCVSEPSGGIVISYGSTGVPGSAVVSGNRVTADTAGVLLTNRPSGIVLYRSSDTVTALVDSNVVQGGYYGIFVGYYSRAYITRNAVDTSWVDAIRVDRSNVDSTAVVADSNNLTRSRGYGVAALDGVNGWVDARDNWWNDSLGPSGFYGDTTGLSTGDSVSVDVRWDPWLTAPAGGAPTPAPQFLVAAAPSVDAGARATPRPLWRPGTLRGSHPVPQRSTDRDMERTALPTPQAMPADVTDALRRAVERQQQWAVLEAQEWQARVQRRADAEARRAAARVEAEARTQAMMDLLQQRAAERRTREAEREAERP